MNTDLQGIALASIKATCTSLLAHLPLTAQQMTAVNEAYAILYKLQGQVVFGDNSNDSKEREQ